MNNVDHMASNAERHLCDANYYGKKYNWNFEKYVTVHKEHQHDLVWNNVVIMALMTTPR